MKGELHSLSIEDIMTAQLKTCAAQQSGHPDGANPFLSSPPVWFRLVLVIALSTVSSLKVVCQCDGQDRISHGQFPNDLVPGAVGNMQLRRGGPLPGYFQPLELMTPKGSEISMLNGGKFSRTRSSVVKAGMLIGPVYRLKVTQIPGHAGQEIFPTIEVIDRTYPPPGQETHFPIPLHITQEEIELAIEGHYVTRVVYLEDPKNAFPVRQIPGLQRVIDIGPGLDPLRIADDYGRPVAILRIGSRIPDEATDQVFGYGSPPFRQYSPAVTAPATPATTTMNQPNLSPGAYGVQQGANMVQQVPYQATLPAPPVAFPAPMNRQLPSRN